MSEQLGYLNYSQLGDRLWLKEDFQKGDDYYNASLRQFILSRHGYGILSGCKVSHVAGMTVEISEGLILFSNGNLVSFPGKQVVISDADGAQDRIDRLALAYSVSDGDEGVNLAGATVVIDKHRDASESVTEGALGGAAPANTAGEISLCAITVTAATANLSDDKIDQSHIYRDLSRDIRKHDRSFSLANNVAVNTEIGDLVFDNTTLLSANLKGFINRVDENQNKRSFVELTLVYDDENAEWSAEYFEKGGVTGITLGVKTTGEAVFQSSNFSATDYECTLTILNIDYVFRN